MRHVCGLSIGTSHHQGRVFWRNLPTIDSYRQLHPRGLLPFDKIRMFRDRQRDPINRLVHATRVSYVLANLPGILSIAGLPGCSQISVRPRGIKFGASLPGHDHRQSDHADPTRFQSHYRSRPYLSELLACCSRSGGAALIFVLGQWRVRASL